MTITVEHATVYRYDRLVRLDPHTFRLRPRMNATQRLLEFDLRIAPVPVGTTESLDQDGNLALHAWFDAPTRELSVGSRFRVEMLRENPFDFLLSGESGRLPLWYPDLLCSALAPYRNATQVSRAVNEYAQSVAASAGWNSISFLAALNQRLFETFRHITRPDGPPWPSELALSLLEGSCRDLAILFCDACRVMGIAARFVSGYECAAAGRQDSYMHAWAEAYLPTAGWRGYDPSRGLVVSNGHVPLAAGFHYDLASPVTGSFSGGASSQMETSLRMDVDHDGRPGPPATQAMSSSWSGNCT